MKHIIPISGKDSLATAIVQKKRRPDIEYEYLFNPVGFELPETLDWLYRVEGYLGKEIKFVGKDLKTTPEWISGFRPSQNARWCTRIGKILPTEDAFYETGYIYYGLRADEPERIGYIARGQLTMEPVYPLREQSIGLSEVLQICHQTGLKPPTFFWQVLKDEFIRRVGEDFLYSRFNEWELDQLFAWRKRNNCYNCFFMARYEWVGLLTHHPALFWWQVEEEEKVDQREHAFTTIKDLPLRQLANKKDEILERYIVSTSRRLNKLKQLKLFDNNLFNDILSTTSCGLFCGK